MIYEDFEARRSEGNARRARAKREVARDGRPKQTWKLSEADITAIRESVMDVRTLAELFHVSVKTVRRVR